MRKLVTCLIIVAILLPSLLLAGCSRDYLDTNAYREFLTKKTLTQSISREETAGDYTYVLDHGILSFLNLEKEELWRSEQYWFVDDFRLSDIDGDGTLDCLFSLWKSYSFYEGAGKKDDPSVKNHLFLYTIRGGHAKMLWGSSNLPRPIYSFELSEGVPTPVATGAILKTVEGTYTEDFTKTKGSKMTYTWQGWGFVPEEEPLTPAPQSTLPAKLSFVGDLMVHSRQLYEAYRPADESYDFSNSFKSIGDHIATADYAIGNLETVLGGRETGYSDFPFFNTPDEFALALKEAGFDLLTTANNHCGDRSERGIRRTLDVLDSLGLDHTGTYRSREEQESVFMKEIKGIRCAFISFTDGTNKSLPPDKAYLVNSMSEENIRKRIEQAKLKKPDIIVVLPHMGDEYESQPSEEWRDWAHFMLDCGADIIIASHPHVLQAVEFVEIAGGGGAPRRGFIAYSVGNFISSQREHPADAGMILNLYLARDRAGKVFLSAVTYTPTWVKFSNASGGFDITVLPVQETLAAIDKGEYFDLSEGDILRMRQVLTQQAGLYLGGEPVFNEGGEFVIPMGDDTERAVDGR